MNRNTMTLVGAVLTAVACGGEAPTATEADSAQGPGPGLPTGNSSGFEVMWMTQMIDHHAMAVEMGTACVQPGAAYHPELLELCGDVIATQTAEIASMTSWLADWYGVTYEAGSNGMMMLGDADLSGLTGDAFEVAFLEEMIPHHQQAVHMSQGCLAHATHPELTDLCASIIEAQSAEIASMQTWRCDWYGDCVAIGDCPGGTGPAGTGPGGFCGDGMGPGPNGGCTGECPADGGGMGPGPYEGGPGPMHGGGTGPGAGGMGGHH